MEAVQTNEHLMRADEHALVRQQSVSEIMSEFSTSEDLNMAVEKEGSECTVVTQELGRERGENSSHGEKAGVQKALLS